MGRFNLALGGEHNISNSLSVIALGIELGIDLGIIKKALSGYPFTIGTILSYMILKNSETKNIVSLLYAKNLGLKKEETASLLNI